MIDLPSWFEPARDWTALIGGTAGLYTFASTQYRRRLRLTVDYQNVHEQDGEWHLFSVHNRSDLTITIRYFGPAWFITSPLGRLQVGMCFDTEGLNPGLTVIAPGQTIEFNMHGDSWQLAAPSNLRERATFRVGIEVPTTGKLLWIKPRKSRRWDLTIREKLIHRMYGLWGANQKLIDWE